MERCGFGQCSSQGSCLGSVAAKYDNPGVMIFYRQAAIAFGFFDLIILFARPNTAKREVYRSRYRTGFEPLEITSVNQYGGLILSHNI